MKRTLTLRCLMLFLPRPHGARAVHGPAPPGVSVVKFKWSKERDGGPPAAFSGTMMTPRDVATRVRQERGRQRVRVQEQPARPLPSASALYAYRLT